MKRTSILSFVALMTLGLSVGLLTSCHPHHGPMDKEVVKRLVSWKMDTFLAEIDATEVQRRELQTTVDRIMDEAMRIHEDGRGDREVFATELMKETPDGVRLHALLDTRLNALRGLIHKGLDALLEAHGTLSPEQRVRIREMVEKD